MRSEREQALEERCRRGDRDAWEEVYRQCEAQLLGTAVRLLGNPAEAEDAVHDTLLKAFRAVERYRGDAALSTWLHRILIHHCYDRLRRRKRRAEVSLEAEAGSLPEMVTRESTALQIVLQRALSTLPPKMKACFVLYVQEGFPQQEVADLLGLKVGTVKSHVFGAKMRLRAILGDRSEGGWHHELS